MDAPSLERPALAMHADAFTFTLTGPGPAGAIKRAAVIPIPGSARGRTRPSAPASKVAAIAEVTKIDDDTYRSSYRSPDYCKNPATSIHSCSQGEGDRGRY